jgi:hypothetical protein
MEGRAFDQKVVVISNTLGGKEIDLDRNDGDVVVWNETLNRYVHRAANDHDHEIGNQVLLFENQLV